MTTPIVFASSASNRRRLYSGDDDGMSLVAPNLGFGEQLLNSFPASARDRIPKEAREMMINPFGSSSSSSLPVSLRALTNSVDGLRLADDDKVNDCSAATLWNLDFQELTLLWQWRSMTAAVAE